ncbi:adenosylcobinamide-phosphate synthase CbiB [Novosphingobium sp. 9]|uniref:adenosylcobinamide-phosphate synthase CbiB n=1 Tax=Novosphingobium sp. 9 TaxID=2025349 RepID=UPI0021B511F4|nr:adenosylcobinamide-phosphate synthase CbiB [Novosphingobium sp. 9]
MAEPVALVALVLDAAFGWPGNIYRRIGHPVGLFACVIEAGERRWNDPERREAARRMLGVVLVVLLLGGVIGVTLAIECLLRAIWGAHAWIFIGALAWPALAQRSLYDHVRPIAISLSRGEGIGARRGVAMIVGRDVEALDAAGIARAAIESLAESFCDGIAAPLFWLLVGGLPGVWAYKAINTADSLIGHREPRWRAFGWAAARLDDVLNLIPARLGGVILCLAGGGGWRVLWRDHARHASPNAGWTEAAMAGVLGLRLAGPVSYDGALHDKPWIGDGRIEACADDVFRALRVYVRACVLLALIAAGIVWGMG